MFDVNFRRKLRVNFTKNFFERKISFKTGNDPIITVPHCGHWVYFKTKCLEFG